MLPYHPTKHLSQHTHKAIQMYNLTKEDLDSEDGKTLHYDFKINRSKESSGIRCRDQRDINTTAVPPWLLTICPSCPVLWGVCCGHYDHHNNIYILSIVMKIGKAQIFKLMLGSFKNLKNGHDRSFWSGIRLNISCQDQGHLLSWRNYAGTVRRSLFINRLFPCPSI